jgi:uncharacterized OB-fold protein
LWRCHSGGAQGMSSELPGVGPDAGRRDAMTSASGLPPATRSQVTLGLTAAAALGRFELQVCKSCGATQYPPREACHRCLSVVLEWSLQSGRGELLSITTLHHSHHEFFRERLPWRIGLVHLDCGVTVLAHMASTVREAPSRVRIEARLDKAGQAALVAFPEAAAGIGADRPRALVGESL